MDNMTVHSSVESATLEATVIRCACGSPESHAGQVCPQGRTEALGVIAEYQRNPLKRIINKVVRRVRKG